MPKGADYIGTTSSIVVVVVIPLSISASIFEGPSRVGVVVVEEDGGSNGGVVSNISGIWTKWYGSHWRAIGFSSAFNRLASDVL